ncbi:MAG: ATP-dependent DNA helicase RecG [Aureliella sp.]
MEAEKLAAAPTAPLAPQKLFEPIQFVPGVGPMRAPLLQKMGIERALDLLFFFPRTYEETATLRAGDELREDERVSVTGSVLEIEERVTQSGKHMLGALLALDGSPTRVRLLWFNQPFRKQDLRHGQRLLATGRLRSTVISWEMVQPQIVKLADEEVPEEQKPLPIYSLTEGLQQAAMRKIFRAGVKRLVPLVEDVLPEPIREQLGVLPIQDALLQMHWPDSLELSQQARKRFVMQELFTLQLAVGLQRTSRQKTAQALACPASSKVHARILNRLGFILTSDQTRAIADVSSDMQRTLPMNRLLQGDVGSGKTVVAQYAMLLCVANGYQAALMAPTEVLARQHSVSLAKSLASSRVRLGLLTGSMPRGERTRLLEQIRAGEIDLVIGTQTLLSEAVEFAKLALVIVDEQHKFGVEQRAKMRRDGSQPHYLVLSATPIPRTIAMTAFGDLDVSIIRDKPPGRSDVKTYLGDPQTLASWWQFVDAQIAQGRQAFVIAPRVQSGDTEDVLGATGVAADLTAGRFAHRRVGLLHGQLDSREKEQVLTAFSGGDLDLLVATTVVEVGIDVPNASVMTILDADRLGLAQLHQLRGRVGRGRHTGYVCAFPSLGCDARDNERLKVFEKTSDGFELAELDLKLRGPGDLIGTRQHGAAELRIADLARDAELVAVAQRVAREVLDSDPELAALELQRVRKQVMRRHGDWLGVSDVG